MSQYGRSAAALVTVVRLTAVTIQYSIVLYGFLFLISEEAD